METIAVIGAGQVGRTLAAAWAKAGHQVMVGSRDPGSEAALEGATVTYPVAAIEASRVVVYTIPGTAMPEVLAEHAGSLAGRVVIDATNNLASGHDAPELSAIRYLPAGVTGFRAFNCVGWENMADPVVGGEVADMFFAGPDGAEREAVSGLIADVGFRPVYAGADSAAFAAVDSVAALWFTLALGRGYGRRLAFRVLTDTGSIR